MMFYKSLVFVLLIFLLNCKENEEVCRDDTTSSISFDYDGHFNGNFSASGLIPYQYSGNVHVEEWAGAQISNDFGFKSLGFHANNPVDGTIESYNLQIEIPDPQKIGVYDIPSCQNSVFLFGGEFSEFQFTFISGEVEITIYDCDVVRGSFFGQLKSNCFSETEYVLNIRNGAFDVRLKK